MKFLLFQIQLYLHKYKYNIDMIKNPSSLIIFSLFFLTISSFIFSKKNSQLNIDAYNKTQSRDYAFYSGLAYCPKKCLENWDCQSGKELKNFGEVSHINNILTLASCFIGYERALNSIIVSFRGSANIQNWIQDFNFQKVSYNCKGCEIHAGFLEDYKIIEQKVDAKISQLVLKYPTASIVTTGHSLGGALSQIAGMRLKDKFGKKVTVHNFGCPRVGNLAMSQYISRRVDTLYRVVHHKDIVPHLPPEAFEYHHSAFEVFWDKQFTTYVICSETGQDKTCSNKYAPDYSAGDHGFYFVDLGSLKC